MKIKSRKLGLLLLAMLALLVVAREPVLRLYYRVDFLPLVLQESKRNLVSPYLVAALIFNESRFRTNSRSEAGARGLMQLMPETAAEMAQKAGIASFQIDSLDEPETNIRLGTLYLAELFERFTSEEDVLAAYNAGPTVVRSWKEEGRGIAFVETRAYVTNVIETKQVLQELYPGWE